MNGLTAETDALVAELVAAGVPATRDPGQVLALLTTHPVAALASPAEGGTFGMGMTTIEIPVPVLLLTRGPFDNASEERLDEATLLAGPVISPLEGWGPPETWSGADVDLPARRMIARRRFPYPLTVHP